MSCTWRLAKESNMLTAEWFIHVLYRSLTSRCSSSSLSVGGQSPNAALSVDHAAVEVAGFFHDAVDHGSQQMQSFSSDSQRLLSWLLLQENWYLLSIDRHFKNTEMTMLC